MAYRSRASRRCQVLLAHRPPTNQPTGRLKGREKAPDYLGFFGGLTAGKNLSYPVPGLGGGAGTERTDMSKYIGLRYKGTVGDFRALMAMHQPGDMATRVIDRARRVRGVKIAKHVFIGLFVTNPQSQFHYLHGHTKEGQCI